MFLYDVELDIVDAFTYLGVDFKFNGKFDCTQNSITTNSEMVHLICSRR